MKSRLTVYVLACELGKYYVGLTNDIHRRMLEHECGDGSVWTRLYRPIELIHETPGNLYKETALTLIYMRKHGWDNVRGGAYTQVNMGAPHVFNFTEEEAELYRYQPIPPSFG